MTMESAFEKRAWIAKLWEETQHDEALRAFIFEGIEESSDVLENRIRDELRKDADLRDELIERLIDYPPPRLRQSVVDELMDDPPEHLVNRIKEGIEEDHLDTIDDLNSQIASLQERLDNYKEEFAAYREKHGANL